MPRGNKAKENKALKEADHDQAYQDNYQDFSDLDTGWAWVVLFASFGTFFLIGNSMYAVGIIHSSLLERYGEKVSLTSWAGALHTAMMSLGGPLSTAVVDRFSCRAAITSSGVFFVVGYLATAFAETINVAIFTCGIIAGTGAALGYTAAMVVVGFNFRRRRNLALGIANSGMGAGLFVLAPIMQLSREYYGPIGFFIILAAMTANIITFGTLCFPSRLELHLKLQRRIQSERSSEKRTFFAMLKPYLSAMYNKGMICLFLCMFFYCLGTYLIYLHLPTFIVTKGFTAVQASFLISLSGILALFGRLLTGMVANLNRINDTVLYSGSMGIVAIASFVYPFSADYFAGHVIYTVLLGLFFGSCYITIIAVSLKFVRMSYVAAAIGLQFCFGGVGAVIGPVCAGVVVDATGTYEISIIVAAICILLGALFSGLTICLKPTDDNGVIHLEETIEIPETFQNSSSAIHTEDRISLT